jgi:gliding motility-associated-like protein
MKLILFSYFLLLLNIFDPQPKGTDPYKGCCGAEPVLINIGDTKVFVPNVFTPNGDGINDVFKPFYNPNKIKIEQISITNAEGKFVWKTEVFNPELSYTAWNGQVSKDSTYTGLFNYTVIFSDKAGVSKVVGGSACSAVCNPKIPITIEDKSKCFFPM